MVGLEELPEDLPEFIDDFEWYIPKNIPRADLILPEMGIESDGLVEKVNVTRTAPCGSTNYIAEHRHSKNL
jgi:hypothetical protein